MNSRHLTRQQKKVKEFHDAVGAYTGQWPHVPPPEIQNIRKKLIQEEYEEFVEASDNGDIVKIADAIADLLVVVNGAALAWGIGIKPVFNEVHRSNMTKIGGPMREDGKCLKGPNYEPPKLEALLEAQIPAEGSEFGA
jgi:predicted HAD superfamily Cof-like phosphohydrolase